MKNKGITLVALIITIIVLLILATISISLVINNNILDKAQHGVDKYSEEEEFEQVKLAVASAMLKGNGFLNTENLNSELRDKFGADKEAIKSSNGWSFELDKNYNIYKDGNVEENKSLLPAEYQQVEYIESTGRQYIDTGVYLPYKADFDIYYKNKKSNDVGNVGFGYYNDNGFTFEEQPWNTSNAKNILIFGTNISDGYSFPSNFFNTVRHVELIGNSLYIDGELFYTYERIGDNVASNSLLLGAFRENNCIKYNSGIIMGKMKFLYNNEVLFNGIPCYRKLDNVVGLYDTVTGQLYTNKGTGKFGYKTEDGTYVAPQ